MAGIAGGLVVGGLYLSLRDNNSTSDATGWLAAGATAGLGAAWYLTRNMAPERPRRGDDLLSSVVPTLAPAANGSVMVLGVSSLM